MTRANSARLAGAMFLAYIAIGITSLVLYGPASQGTDPAARLDAIASHLTPVRISILLNLLTGFVALTLGVALYALTREVDRELALLALTCRLVEAVMAAVSGVASMALVALATGQVAVEPEVRSGLGALLLRSDTWFPTISAIAFAVGSTLFCYLFLRGRIVPVPLAWLGLVASLLLVVLLPARLVNVVSGPITSWMWLPMLFFEVPCGIWLLTKGAGEAQLAPAQ
ncbi:MAG TPA: DUF4386 domain-containing protein [Gemmatimonadales bacterium]|nr:DUF4386 domain-containing protein [Gemmatimonadales bacterium]